MDFYMVSLATGAVGLGIMGIGGFSHGAHAGLTHGGRAGHAHVGHGPAARAARDARAPGSASGWRWTSLLSPRLLFSLMVGFGAGGIVAALLIGAVAGLYPSVRASRLSPTEALRTV